jgi:hypothetical protein
VQGSTACASLCLDDSRQDHRERVDRPKLSPARTINIVASLNRAAADGTTSRTARNASNPKLLAVVAAPGVAPEYGSCTASGALQDLDERLHRILWVRVPDLRNAKSLVRRHWQQPLCYVHPACCVPKVLVRSRNSRFLVTSSAKHAPARSPGIKKNRRKPGRACLPPIRSGNEVSRDRRRRRRVLYLR